MAGCNGLKGEVQGVGDFLNSHGKRAGVPRGTICAREGREFDGASTASEDGRPARRDGRGGALSGVNLPSPYGRHLNDRRENNISPARPFKLVQFRR